MAIKTSSARQIDTLIANLSADDALTRESAVARLTVIGARAVERLIAAAESAAPAAARVAAFRALEGIADPRALGAALRATGAADPNIAASAIAVARTFIRGPRGASVVDALTGIALARNRPESVRVGALRSLMALERSTIAPLLASLASDPNAMIRSEAARQTDTSGRALVVDPIDELTRAAEQELPDDASLLHAAIVSAGDTVALPVLLRIVERVREREASEAPRRRMEWMRVRAAAHAALARRGSRIAIYDLRESLTSPDGSLPVDFLSALSSVGDPSCLEAIAAAYTGSNETWFRDHLGDAFRAIVAREKLTRRHSVMKRIAKRWSGCDLWSARL